MVQESSAIDKTPPSNSLDVEELNNSCGTKISQEHGEQTTTPSTLPPSARTRDSGGSSMELKASAMMEHLTADQRAVLQEVLNATYDPSVEFGVAGVGGAVNNRRTSDNGLNKSSDHDDQKGNHPKLGVGIPALQETKGIVGAHAIPGIDAAPHDDPECDPSDHQQKKGRQQQQQQSSDRSLLHSNHTKAPDPIHSTRDSLSSTRTSRASTNPRASVVGAFAITMEEQEFEEEEDYDNCIDALERGNGLEDDTLYTDLVVAQLAEGHSELLMAKEQENQALRDELLRISTNTVEAEQVQVQVITTASMEKSTTTLPPPPISEVILEEKEEDPKRGRQRQRRLCLWSLILVLIVVTLVVVVSVPVAIVSSSKTEANEALPPPLQQQQEGAMPLEENLTQPLLPVLDTIKKNDVIRCRAETVEVNKGEGLTIDLCRALAAAVLGDPSKVVFLKIPFRDQFRAISMGEIDVSTTLNTLNMERDVYHQSGYGYTFSDPYFYSGNTFAGLPDFVDCVDRGETFEGICRQLVICVIEDTTTKDLVNQHLPGASTNMVKNGKDLLQDFADGLCNVMVESPIAINEQRVRDLNFTGDYVFAKSGSWTVEPLAMITRQSDPQWSDFVNWVLRSLITAESLDITQENADTFPQTNVFGEEYQNMFQQALGAVGNYGQMYERHFQNRVPRQGMNLLHRGEPATGLLVADPLGDILIDESLHQIDPTPNGTLEAVMRRGYLRCGLSEERVGFAEFDTHSGTWSGLDVEFCKGISASIFAGRADTIVYESFDGTSSGQYRGLADGLVDVLAGAIMSLRSDVNEPMTGRGYAFSPPYFFEEKGARRSMLTREDDHQWSDLVRWVSQAPIYAEGEGIEQKSASMMPIVELFSTDLRQMLRDTIGTIGNYEELYNRTMEHHIPRHGWNQMNSGNDPQHFPYSFED